MPNMSVAERRKALLHSIRDAYSRMATADDYRYTALQKEKCDAWLIELRQLYSTYPEEYLAAQMNEQ